MSITYELYIRDFHRGPCKIVIPEGHWNEVLHPFKSLAFLILSAVRYQPCYQTGTRVKIGRTVRDTGHHVTFFYYPFNQRVTVLSALPLQILQSSNEYYLDLIKFMKIPLQSGKKYQS